MTREYLKEGFLGAFVIVLLILAGGSVGFFGARMWAVEYPPCEKLYVPAQLDKHSIKVVDNDRLEVTRYWVMTSSGRIKVIRGLLGQTPYKFPYSVPLLSSEGSHPEGPGTQVILVDLPAGISPGKYSYLTRVSWSCGPLKEQFVDLPPLTVELTAVSK